MRVVEIIEGYKQVWGRSKKGIVARYRCTDGPKKGRVVAKASTCASTTNRKKSHKLATTRKVQGLRQSQKRKLTTARPTHKRLTRVNRRLRSKSKKKFKR